MTDYIVFDTETTGLSPEYGDKIVEIAAIKVIGDKLVDTFETLINPLRRLGAEAMRVNKITEDMVRKAPTMGQAMPFFVDFIAGLPLVAHNAQFDRSFLQAELALHGFEISPTYICTVELSRNINPHLPRHNLDTLINYYEIKIPKGYRHRALGDVYATWELYKQLLSELK